MVIKCKRIIKGKTYNTETATLLAGWDDDDPELPFQRGRYLYHTRFGAFFLYLWSDEPGMGGSITPCSPVLAREWLEKNKSYRADMIESLFGAVSGEIRYTLRLPESLRDRLAALAKANKQSLNAWMIRCLEGCAAPALEKDQPAKTQQGQDTRCKSLDELDVKDCRRRPRRFS